MRRRARTRPRPAGDDAGITTRETILAAALEVFAEQGFDGARTRDIADRAGANLGLIKYYFESKERLWKAAVGRAFDELRAELGELADAPGDGASVLDLEQIVRRFVHFVARRPAFMRLMNDEGKRDGPRMRWLADRYVRPVYEAMRARVERAQSVGALPPIPAANLHYIVLGAAGLVFSQAPECRRITGVDPASTAFAEAHVAALVGLLTTSRPA